MKHIATLVSCTFFILQGAFSQTSTQASSSDILQQLHKLNTVGSVLYIAAHPDDENTRLLAYLANEQKLRTGYLSLTRGDGGQNLIGKEQGSPLGLIRTHELLAARSVDGAEQFFTRANDFGFSKGPDETFGIWNKDSILADVVWTIRRFKPDVLICRFPTTGEGGHGHHTASAILAQEAFTAAADPTRFPEQLKYTEVWQAKRIFWNTFNFGTVNTTAPDQLKIDVGNFNPLLGKSYGEIAAESRSMHKSQGFGSAKTRGEAIEYFKQLGGETATTSLFDGINLSWKRLPAGAAIHKKLATIIANFDALHPEKSVATLVQLHKLLTALDSKDPLTNYWKQQKLKETECLLVSCSGLWFEATAKDFTAIPGKDLPLTVQIISRNHFPATLHSIRYLQQDSTLNLTLKNNELYTFRHTAHPAADLSYSNPYWLQEKHTPGLYSVHNPFLVGKPENAAAASVTFDVSLEGLHLTVTRDVVYKYTDPVKGEIYRALEMLPAVTLNPAEKVYVSSDNLPKKIQFTVKANQAGVEGDVVIHVPAGWKILNGDRHFKLSARNEEVMLEATIVPTELAISGKISISATVDGQTYHQSIHRIEYDHIPYQFILQEAEATLTRVSLKRSGQHIGYIPGAGDDVAACLSQIGYTVTELTDELLSSSDLSVYDAIVTGVRAYNVNERLQAHYPRLMAYVEQGGNLVVQYNTNNRIGPLLANIGPYPFAITRDRVTDETATVELLEPAHPAFTFPNPIGTDDFSNWVQERGIYFASEVDAHYASLLSMHDPNEKALTGSLLVTSYGKGNFVYTGLAFFRELPAGVPGAYRLFVNLLSLPKH
jgi:LmbE family N-acetylglucosaminyl deacetylase